MTARDRHNREKLHQLGPLRLLEWPPDWQAIAQQLRLTDADEAKRLLSEIAMNRDLWIVDVQDRS